MSGGDCEGCGRLTLADEPPRPGERLLCAFCRAPSPPAAPTSEARSPVAELVDLLDKAGMTVTFDLLRDPNWQPTREFFAELQEGVRAALAAEKSRADSAERETAHHMAVRASLEASASSLRRDRDAAESRCIQAEADAAAADDQRRAAEERADAAEADLRTAVEGELERAAERDRALNHVRDLEARARAAEERAERLESALQAQNGLALERLERALKAERDRDNLRVAQAFDCCGWEERAEAAEARCAAAEGLAVELRDGLAVWDRHAEEPEERVHLRKLSEALRAFRGAPKTPGAGE